MLSASSKLASVPRTTNKGSERKQEKRASGGTQMVEYKGKERSEMSKWYKSGVGICY